MHELGLLTQMAETVTRAANENNIDHVCGIVLEVGEASGALPYTFEEYFPMIKEDYPVLRDASLRLLGIKSRALCAGCNAVYDLMKNEGACPRCGEKAKTVLGGTDVIIKQILY